MTTTTAPASDVRIVPMTLSMAEVRLSLGTAVVSIGRVGQCQRPLVLATPRR